MGSNSATPAELLLVFSTAPDGATAERLGRQLVEERLVACVNVVPGLRSIYRWQGEVQEEAEVLLLMKTQAARLPMLERRLRELHPYEVPELLAAPVVGGLDAYCRWVLEETAAEPT